MTATRMLFKKFLFLSFWKAREKGVNNFEIPRKANIGKNDVIYPIENNTNKSYN